MTVGAPEPRLRGARVQGARLLLAFAVLAAGWAILAVITGGLRFHVAGLVLSSRNPTRPAVLASLAIVAAWYLDRARVDALARWVADRLSAVGPYAVGVGAAGVLAAGIVLGGRSALGSDPFGYISQSVLWQRGDLRIAQPFVAQMPWPDADWTFTPLGYRPAADHALVPTYAPGFPLMLAAARFLSACAPYYVVPVSAALLVWLTAVLGRRVFGAPVGFAGALMVAASPVLLMWVLRPMSDVPVSMFWLAALLAADRASVGGSAAAGILTGIAIAIRPNLAPLAIFPLLLSAVHGGSRRALMARGAALIAAVVPFAIFVAVVHNALYGSPLASGYGSLSSIYSLRHLPANVIRYPSWWWYAHGVLGWLFLAALFRPRDRQTERRVYVLVGFALAVVLSYMFYLPFDQWLFLRFMLPALPIAMLLSADAAAWAFARLGPAVSACALAAVTAVAVMQGVHRARWDGFFHDVAIEQRYTDAGLYIGSSTPPATVVLAMQHSGSVRFYSGRLTLRYDLLDPEWLDRAIDRLEALGYSTYALLEDWEVERFRARFPTQRGVRLVDAVPVAVRPFPGGELRFFALRAGPSPSRGETATIPFTPRLECVDPSPGFATVLPAKVDLPPKGGSYKD